MNLRETRFYKPVLLLVAAALLLGVGQVQKGMNADRKELGLTRQTPLENTPPILAFTTVALGGFRGLIANALWIRLNELQEDDKYFEMVQLADWITKLEPHFSEVWNMNAWNMAYNISVKFTRPEDRWRWVQRGISLLRDEGLRYNPDNTDMYWQLSFIFQHKVGHNLDDAHRYYKQAWMDEMASVLGKKPDYAALLNPKTDAEKQRAQLLREKYKMDPQIMKDVDERYGPLEWRLPDAHAIYWAEAGRRHGSPENQEKLLRSIYQTMQSTFRRGAIFESKINGNRIIGPNIHAVANINKSYEEPMDSEDAEIRKQPEVGHKNFLRDAVYFLYIYGHRTEAQKWMDYLKKKYPDSIASYVQQYQAAHPGQAVPANPTVDEYSVMRVTEEADDTDTDRTTAIVLGLIQNAFVSLVEEDDERSQNYFRMAEKIWSNFQQQAEGTKDRIRLKPMNELKQMSLEQLLDPEKGLPPEAAATLRSIVGGASAEKPAAPAKPQ